MKTVYLVRHGEASWQGDEYDVLTDRGVDQSRVVGQAFVERGIVPDLVVSGELKRHRQSAAAALEAAGWSAALAEDARWAEMDYIDIIKAVAPQYSSHAELKVVAGEGPSGNEEFAALFQGSLRSWIAQEGVYTESFEQFCARVYDAFDHVLSQLDDDQTAVVFTSGGPIGAIANRALEGPADGWLKLLVSVNTGISTFLQMEDRTVILVSLNEHSHVQKAALVTY